MEGYITVKEYASDEFTERKSRFIGHIKPVATEEEAAAFVGEIRQKYWDAAHNVYAYVLRNGQARRYSDDGEPQGTAGVPVLDVLLKENIADAAVVVTRYFGGILLGGGGLIRAYSHGAKLAVDAAALLRMVPCTVLEMSFDYGTYGKISNLLSSFTVKVLSQDFGVLVTLRMLIRDDDKEHFLKELTELTAARVVPAEKELLFAHME